MTVNWYLKTFEDYFHSFDIVREQYNFKLYTYCANNRHSIIHSLPQKTQKAGSAWQSKNQYWNGSITVELAPAAGTSGFCLAANKSASTVSLLPKWSPSFLQACVYAPNTKTETENYAHLQLPMHIGTISLSHSCLRWLVFLVFIFPALSSFLGTVPDQEQTWARRDLRRACIFLQSVVR